VYQSYEAAALIELAILYTVRSVQYSSRLKQ